MRKIYSLSSAAIRIYMKLTGNLEVVGKENLRDWKPCIVAANHISYYDPPFIGAVLSNEIHYLAKKELFSNKFFGSILRFYNAIPVKRGVIDREALNNVIMLLNEGHSILLFPEGSRKSFTAKSGVGLIVYKTGVPILPVKIENSNRLMKCFQRKKKLRIIIGEMIDASGYLDLPPEKKTYKKIAEDVLEKINSLNAERNEGNGE